MPVLTDTEIAEIILTQLPRLLDEKPDLDTAVYRLVAKHFAERGELDKVKQELIEFRAETKENFDKVDERFDKVDERFDKVDERFENFRYETQQNFAKVHERADKFETETRENFAQVGQRIDSLENRVGNLEVSVEDLRTDMNQGFKDVFRHIDRLGQRWGIRNEVVFRETMKSVLEKSFGVKVETRKIEPDDEQFDLIISNGQHILIEISASAKRNIAERLIRKRELYTAETGVTPSRFIYAVGSIHSRRLQALQEAGIEVVEGEDDWDEE